MASWTTSQWCAAIGCTLILISFGFGTYVVAKKGKSRRMTHQELKKAILRDDITDMPTYSVAGPGVGVKIEATADLDTMREAAARGEWGVFWSWPITIVCLCTGGLLIFVTVAIESKMQLFAWIGGLCFGPWAIAWIVIPIVALFSKRETKDEDAELPDWLKHR
jgi:hypothetical protein